MGYINQQNNVKRTFIVYNMNKNDIVLKITRLFLTESSLNMFMDTA
jgi:hypothetical protein